MTNEVPSHVLNPAHIQYMAAVPDVDPSLLTIDMIRKVVSGQPCPHEPKPEASIQSIQVPTDDGRSIKVDIYRPKDVLPETVLPTLVYLPGGGWCLPPQGCHYHIAPKLAIDGHCAVLLVNYSISPEVKFPVAANECFSVFNWVLNAENAKNIAVDPSRVVVAGDSAGGNLTVALTLLAKRHGVHQAIKRQMLFYPILDATWSSESYKIYGDKNYFSSRFLNQLLWDNYKSSDADVQNVLACPARVTVDELKEFPSAFIVTSEVDPLRDEAEEYSKKLLLAGVQVSSMRVLHAMHGFLSVPGLFCEESLNVIDAASGILRRTFAK
ncbi:hypothetical protein CU097_012559 [Rhizopus azygosporus]|uniref:Alpha/beta hydrolase fold-3 domain-containing protein n=1 Tax=Rhizopus azygosporus TaxID=86630 RepID=A0A367JRF1_RHIAZ|nr:hypothetical protein CU097_012559 [Rhizopus azygosporus]